MAKARKVAAAREGAWHFDHQRKNHPDVMIQLAVHDAQCKSSDHAPMGRCPAVAHPDDVDAVWEGRRRMAAARQAAGRPLDEGDLDALARPLPGGQ